MAVGEYAAIRDHRRIPEGFVQLDRCYCEIDELISVQRFILKYYYLPILLDIILGGPIKEYINLIPQVTDDISDLFCHNRNIRVCPRTIQNSGGKFFVQFGRAVSSAQEKGTAFSIYSIVQGLKGKLYVESEFELVKF